MSTDLERTISTQYSTDHWSNISEIMSAASIPNASSNKQGIQIKENDHATPGGRTYSMDSENEKMIKNLQMMKMFALALRQQIV